MSESKTPNYDATVFGGVSDAGRIALDKDIAALEARHADELRRREDSYQEALIKLQNRNDAVLEEIARVKREAYEEAIKTIKKYQDMGSAATLTIKELREKAGKL